ncbi:DNA/RNA polymerase [Trametopsis cervina]|nr:DNA/RNA polymerase [Trametopsis cervina]
MPKPDVASEPGPSQDSASFLRRLAGPSIMKAGLAKDQTEINRIIAEASKGSKFYDNEKRKDKDLTGRIERILKQRDEALRGADLDKVEASVDQILARMEAQRDLTQIIVHVDMDAFYANVELLDDPSLKGKPFAVGYGVVSTASYEARKYGVRSGMAGFIAKKLCPELIFVSSHFPRYSELSSQIMNIFRRYDPNMQPAGCDEGYLNITNYCEEHLIPAAECVQQMRTSVYEETGLTVSAGIAPNKMLAKICSDKNKPNGQFMLDFTPKAVKAFVHDLPIRKIPGVGRVNERLLDSIGIKTCGDIFTYRTTISLMDKQFGLTFLLQTYLGIASNAVEPPQREERKSIGAERTFQAIGEKDEILAKLDEVAAELEEDMERTGWTGKTVTLKYKLDTYQVFTRAKSFDRWISTKKEDLFAIGKELLLPELPLKIRLIGLRVTKLKDLRSDADPKPGTIKRFFENASVPASPRKKRKLDHEEDAPSLSQDGYEESMPNYHEDVESDIDEEASSNISISHGSPKRRPPASAPSASGSADAMVLGLSSQKPASFAATGSVKPGSGVTARQSSPEKRLTPAPAESGRSAAGKDGIALLTCPLCSKTIETDNDGLNAHIDYCLSKDAIRDAQAKASGSTSRSLKPSAKASGLWTKRTVKRK